MNIFNKETLFVKLCIAYNFNTENVPIDSTDTFFFYPFLVAHVIFYIGRDNIKIYFYDSDCRPVYQP